jgi:tetratricopeptide (TPR) repeat protein
MNRTLAMIVCAATLTGAVPQDETCRKKAAQALRVDEYEAALTALIPCAQDPETWRLKAVAYHRLFNPDSAAAYFAMAIDKESVDDALRINFSEVLLWKKEFKRAGEMLERVVDKAALPYRKVYALRLEMLGKFDDAIAFYDSMIAVEKQPWNSMVRKGEVLSWQKKYNEATALFTAVSAVENAPKSLRMYALIRRAEVKAWQKESAFALNELDKVISMDANPGLAQRPVKDRVLDALRLKGTILEWNGKYREAKDAYKNMLLIDPENKRAKLLLEKLLWVK